MALFLSIETSTHHFSCALHQDEKLIAFNASKTAQSTASMLAVMIQDLFLSSATRMKDLNAVVVASGPGSYTGLRIGVATAKGICYALGLPLISCNTLLLMANQFIEMHSEQIENNALLCPMLDARRMEVYCLITDKKLEIALPTQAKVIDETSFSDQLASHPTYFFGEGAEKCRDILKQQNAKFISGLTPSAIGLGKIGTQKFLKKDFEDLALFEPYYLKNFVVKKPNQNN
ncbi:MAG: tRNA (adenosine(37)-N6)-threonylcarbamoyltransferase complex dimerization subunit type 1 TsaB [Bacteroidetes bacterium]|nr:tRNA (adenosine(37)-N6)-threonylcarbamoyltransferase complex dimerization subunit type 1 TsaB [Bacteroidota bacterium]